MLLCIVCALAPATTVRAQTILFDVPIALQAPRYNGIMMAWNDGELFWVDVVELIEILGYEVQTADSAQVVARDARRVLAFDAIAGTLTVNREPRMSDMESMTGAEGQMLISLDALQTAFGSDMEWDEAGLTLRISSAASLFDPTRFGSRRPLGSEPPAKVLFPRERSLLGGVQLNYDLQYTWSRTVGHTWSGQVRTTAAMAGGVVRANLSRRNPTASYTIVTGRPWLTRAQVDYRHSQQTPSLRLTNEPLVLPRIFAEQTQRGQTIPHAIVRAKVGGTPTDQTQADGEGRYSVRMPLFYGTTRSSIEVEPLGEDPMEPEFMYYLTPRSALPRGRLQYDLRASDRGTMEIAYGVSNFLTVRGTGGIKPNRGIAGVTARLLPAVVAEADADLIQGTGSARLRHWQGRSGLEVDYRRYRDNYHVLTGTALFQFRELSVSSAISHRRFPNASPTTEISPSLRWYSRSGIGASLTGRWLAGQPDFPSMSPQVSWRRSVRRSLVFVSGGVNIEDGKVRAYRSSLRVSDGRWSFAVQGDRGRGRRQSQLRLSLQLNTDWAWIGANSRVTKDDVRVTQRVRGTVGIDRGLSFSAIVQNNSQAVFRVFVDENLNGTLDDTERPLPGPQINLHSHPLRRMDGVFRALNLSPNETYTVSIRPESIMDPMLYPATGYEFAFVAEAGRTRYIDIPLQLLPLVEGRLTGWPAAYEVLSIEVSGMGMERTLDVYRDGAFFTQLLSGTYDIKIRNRVTKEILMEQEYTINATSSQIVINMEQSSQ